MGGSEQKLPSLDYIKRKLMSYEKARECLRQRSEEGIIWLLYLNDRILCVKLQSHLIINYFNSNYAGWFGQCLYKTQPES